MQNIINENVKVLEKNGLILQSQRDDENYFYSRKHFEFRVQNVDEFLKYLKSYTKTPVSSSFYNILRSGVIASDVEYSNIPFSKSITMEVYPLSLSKKLMNQMKQTDVQAFEHLKNFLQAKGILYHIDYNLLSKDFNGFIKDINDKYTFKDNQKIAMVLQNVRFNGEGELFSPSRFEISVDKVYLSMNKGSEKLFANIDNFKSSSNLQSLYERTSDTKIYTCNISIHSPKGNLDVSMKDMETSLSSTLQNGRVNMHFKNYIDTFKFDTPKMWFALNDLNSEVAIKNLHKEKLAEFSHLLTISKTIAKSQFQKEMQKSLLALLSHGLNVRVKDVSIGDITINKTEDLGSMKIFADLKMKEDKDLTNKFQASSKKLLDDLQMQAKIKLANALFLKLIEESPMAQVMVSYAKKDADAFYFDIVFRNAKLMINDKYIQ